MKRTFIFVYVTLLFSTLFALPGFTPYLPDNSGDYVYYRDNSFERESYIGFLGYDDSTYQLRYYAPADKKDYLPEKNIQILFTINPDKPYLEMTGERIISAILPGTEDTEIVNYLHDMFYEFSARRIKADPVTPEEEGYKTVEGFWNNGSHVKQEFGQFGGNVTVVFDVLVPLFNIKKIVDPEGFEILTLETFGTLNSSTDYSFDDFKGIDIRAGNAGTVQQINSAAAEKEYDLDGKKIVLDENWTQSMQNLWLLGDAALMSAASIPMNQAMKDRFDWFVIRRLIMSSPDTYVDAPSISIRTDKNGYTILSNICQPKTQNSVKNYKILARNKSGSFDMLLLTAFQKDFTANRKYFENLIKKNK